MAQTPQSSSTASVPRAFLNERRAGWEAFTKAIVIACAHTAALLLFLLLLFKVIL